MKDIDKMILNSIVKFVKDFSIGILLGAVFIAGAIIFKAGYNI